MSYLRLKKSNCKNCYKCIRHCPVKSIRFSDGQANIVEDECILCGMCFVACPQNAKQIRNDVGKAKELIASGTPVYVSIAPSFVANYDGIGITALNDALKKLGFAGAEETAEGAQLVTEQYEKLVADGEHKIIISSCCHTVNTLIQKYYPQALPYLAQVKSPMLAHGEILKKKYPGCHTVFIGPCLSKKAEADAYAGAIDCVLTFEELTGWLKEENIDVCPVSDNAGRSDRAKTRLYPTTSGILRSMNKDNPEYLYMAIDGVENCMAALKDIEDGKIHNCFIEMSACSGSCIGGPVMEKFHRAPVKDYMAVARFAGKKDFEVEQPDSYALQKNFTVIERKLQPPSEAEITEILHRMGKTKPSDELNCGSCGYNTCREKAIAIYHGKAEISMCLPYLKDKAESFSDNIVRNTPNGLILLNEKLEVQQINKAALKIMNLRSPSDILGDGVVRVLDPQDFLTVLQTGRNIHDKPMYLAEYDKYVEETIIYDKEYRLLICIMRDVTQEETVREQKENISRQTVEIADKVVDKQMRIVQEIASLLGETAAETKIALSKLKESISNE